MTTQASLSICIVNWNTCALLRDCLRSIFADPDAVAWQVIVVDNASRDHSVTMVHQAFPAVELVASDDNVGFSRASNIAMEHAHGRHIILLNSDTRVEVGALGNMVALAEAEPTVGAVGPMLLNADGSLQNSCGILPSFWIEISHKLLLHKALPIFRLGRYDLRATRPVGWVTGACLLVRRKTLAQVGPLDPRFFMFYEDLDWCQRIRQAGWQILYAPESRVLHYGGQSSRRNFSEMLVISHQSLFYYYNKHFTPVQVYALRLMTLVEMFLRGLLWGTRSAILPERRCEGLQRLFAYCHIARRTLTDRSYWAPSLSPDH